MAFQMKKIRHRNVKYLAQSHTILSGLGPEPRLSLHLMLLCDASLSTPIPTTSCERSRLESPQ